MGKEEEMVPPRVPLTFSSRHLSRSEPNGPGGSQAAGVGGKLLVPMSPLECTAPIGALEAVS